MAELFNYFEYAGFRYMTLLRKILFPIVPIYYAVTSLRNKLYDLGVKKSKSYKFPIICVGNLSVGGTGKTPMIEYLVALLKADYKVATLSRGYGRKTKGFLLANENATAETLGDEPFQFYNKFEKDITVAVDENRNHGITSLMDLKDVPKVILLDDAFQHRKVKAGFNVLLTTYNNIYTKDFMLPTGNLREPRNGAIRANIIIVTKCPKDLSEEDKNDIIKDINPKDHQDVFFSSIRYSNHVISNNDSKKVDDLPNFTLVTGIANSVPLVDFLDEKGLKFDHLNFKDHHGFSEQEVADLSKKELVVTTEKDFMRLKQYKSLRGKLYYLPITVSIPQSQKLNRLIIDFVKR